jgi:hemoglobin-like flavoprotein
MTMTIATSAQVQESWAAVLDRAPGAVQAFYDRLLDIDPQLGRLFRGVDMGEQGRALVRTLTAIVRELDGPLPAPALPHGGTWETAHLMVVGNALFALLEHALGVALTSPLRAAWMAVFAAHASEIRRAALGAGGVSRVVPLERRRTMVVSGS